MKDKTLEVGTNGAGEVVINHPYLELDENGYGHIVFSVDQAYALAAVLRTKAAEAAKELYTLQESARIKNIPPVDRTARVLADGSPVPEDNRHTVTGADGQQQAYVVLSEEERSKGFVRPYRDAYRHLTCGKITTMGQAIAQTYARDPHFYTGTFCSTCCAHFPVGEHGEFVWYEMNGLTGPKVGT